MNCQPRCAASRVLTALDLWLCLARWLLGALLAYSGHICHRLALLLHQALSYTSIGILAIFTAELVAKLLVFGITYFTHSR